MESPRGERIKVAIVINDFLIGGAQKLLVDMLTRLDRTRFEPSLITLFRFGESEQEYLYSALPKDVPVYELRFSGAGDLRSWRTLYRTLRALSPDVVLSNLFFSNTVVRVLKPFFKYRVLAVEHNTYTLKSRFHQLIDRVLAPLSARVIAVSRTVAAFTAAQEGINPEKFMVIHNGINVEAICKETEESDPAATRRELGIASDERVIINVARVVPQKNHRLLLEGFARFSKINPQYRLVVVGGGSHLEKIQAYAKTLGLGDRVLFLGYRKDIPRYLAIADFFVSTSLIEGFGIAHAEALAAGVPVLTTKTAGPDEMITEGGNGFFITANTPEAVAEGLAKMTAQDLAPMRAAARESARRYSLERMVGAYEALFSETALEVRGATF